MRSSVKKYWGAFLAGTVWGAVLMFIGGLIYLRSSLIVEKESNYDFDSTISKIATAVEAAKGWKLRAPSCILPAAEDGSKIRALQLCNMKYAKEMLDDPASRNISAAIPCSISVYERSDGKTYVSRLNMPLLTAICGGKPAEVFSEKIKPEQKLIMSGICK